MRAVILSVGDELLIGQVINTNAAWIGEQLAMHGIDVVRAVALGDTITEIQREIAQALADAPVVVMTGGLGPTHDDVTREAVAALFDAPLRFNEQVDQDIRVFFEARRRPMPESNRRQAMVPEGFTVLRNPVGTAPGLWHEDQSRGERRVVVILPGVPFEMRHLMQHEVLPRLDRWPGRITVRHRTLLTTGIGESLLQDRLGDLGFWIGEGRTLAYLPSTTGVRLRISVRGRQEEEVQRAVDAMERHIRERLGAMVFGEEDDTLEGVVGEMLRQRGLTVALAESCTGGYVAHRLTNVAGASSYVKGGIVAYSNDLKKDLLAVDPVAIAREGAVSETVARQMAEGVRLRLGVDIGLSTTGIAGPSGGTAEKPVGTLWIGYSDANRSFAVVRHLAKDRLLNKELSATAVFNVLRNQLTGMAPE